MRILVFSLIAANLAFIANGFYVPGIAPREFSRGSKIGELFADDLANYVKILNFFYIFRGEGSQNDLH
jgi:hypothetical protein